jgi:hypothetical protein
MGIKEVQEGKANCSTIFLLPGVGLQKKDIAKYGFIGAFIDDMNHEPHYDKAVYVVFKPDSEIAFEVFLNKEYRRAEILEDYDYPGGYVVVVYKFNEKFERDFKWFMRGKYSNFSKAYKKLFAKKVIVENENGARMEHFSLQYLIFERADAIKEYWESKLDVTLDKDAEYWSAPNLEKDEKLNIRDLKH